jgi:hypothetical protein
MLEIHARQRQPMIADLTTDNPHNSVRYFTNVFDESVDHLLLSMNISKVTENQ